MRPSNPRTTTGTLGALPLIAVLSGCMPTLGARAGAAVLSQPHTTLAMSELSAAVGTQELPVVMGVATAQVGPDTRGYLAGVELNLPLARGVERRVFPRTPWVRARLDFGTRTIYEKSGATLGFSAGIGYPLLIVPASHGDASHVLKLNAEFRIFTTAEVDVLGGVNLEYLFVSQP